MTFEVYTKNTPASRSHDVLTSDIELLGSSCLSSPTHAILKITVYMLFSLEIIV